MGTIVLESKLNIPPRPQGMVPRPRLRNAIEQEITHSKLTLISAPAGSGKTTLLADWARASSLPVAWLSITGEEVDVEHFLRYLLAAWEKAQPGVAESPLGVLLETQRPDIKAVLAAFINAANQAAAPMVFVLDDYHLIEEDSIHEAMIFLLDHSPANLHFVIASRNDPQLRLARHRARGQLLEIRAGDLSFTREETAEFINRSIGVALQPDEVEALHAGTEGWAAGLQLAMLALRQRQSGPGDMPVVHGRQRFIADYLREDIFDQLPVEMQSFLLKTSLLERLCGDLCDTVTGGKNGQAMLDKIERENLFITPLDDERTWFSSHPLFADFLRGELERRHSSEVPEIHRRAASWYEANDYPDAAFRHALAGGQPEQVIKIIDKYYQAKLNGGELKVVEHWIDSIPADWYAAYPVLGLMRAGLLAYNGAYEACVRLVDEVEQRLAPGESEGKRWQLAWVMAFRCFIACSQYDLERAETYAERALRAMPDDEPGFRPGVYGALGDVYRHHGRWEEARECYLTALQFTYSPSVRLHSAHAYGALADLELRQGRLKNAAGYWRKALVAIQERENWGRLPLPVTGWVYIRTGELLYEWNQLGNAWDHVSRGFIRAELGGDVRALFAGYLIAARIKLAEGEPDAAAEYLEKVRNLSEQVQIPEWVSKFERFQLELWLAQDRLGAAVNWSNERLRSPALIEQTERAAVQLTIARVLILKGGARSLEEASGLLTHLLETAEAQGQSGVYIEALALRSLLEWKRGFEPAAMVSLEHALRAAEPEGYVRLFVDLGLPMVRLLQEARRREVMTDYVEMLLAACEADQMSPSHPALAEPLTSREQEILELVAAGLTNQEIAARLVISPETVKKHTGNIYGKLGVNNRTEAAARARELDLLG